MTYNFGEKKYMQKLETNINGQEVTIIEIGIEPTVNNFKKKIQLERIFKYDAIAKPIKNNIYPIDRFRKAKPTQSKEKTFRK